MRNQSDTIQFIDRQRPYGVDRDFTDTISDDRFDALKKHYENTQFHIADLKYFEDTCTSNTSDTVKEKLHAVLEYVKCKYPLPSQEENIITKPAEYSEERMVAIAHAAAAIEYLVTNKFLPEGKVYVSLHNLAVNIIYEDFETANLWVMEENAISNALILYDPLAPDKTLPGFIKRSDFLKTRSDYCKDMQDSQKDIRAVAHTGTSVPALTVWRIMTHNIPWAQANHFMQHHGALGSRLQQ